MDENNNAKKLRRLSETTLNYYSDNSLPSGPSSSLGEPVKSNFDDSPKKHLIIKPNAIRISSLLNPPSPNTKDFNLQKIPYPSTTPPPLISRASSTPSPLNSLNSPSNQKSTSPSNHQVRRFQCNVCGKRYMTGAHLIRHERVHTGAKPFQCPFPGCGSKFSRNDNCMQHYKTHNNPRGKTTRRMNKIINKKGNESS